MIYEVYVKRHAHGMAVTEHLQPLIDEVECDYIERNDDSITFMKRYQQVKEGPQLPFIEAMYMVSEIVKIKLKKL